MSTSGIPQELVVFVQVLGEDNDLRAWFDSFAGVPEWARAEEFRKLADRMKAGGEHPDLVQATALLAKAEVYQAVTAALAELEQGK